MNETDIEYFEVIQSFTELCDEFGIKKVINDLPEHIYMGILYYLRKEERV